jgi:predicted GNAT family acetyltransferase
LIINHKDGNKLNPHYDNLEWTDYSGNNNHAYETGLKYTTKIKVRNAETKEISFFNSLSSFAIFANVRISNILNSCSINNKKLINGLYEVKFMDDNSGWIFEDKENKVGSESIRFKLIDANRNVEIIYGFNKLAKRLGLEIFECRRKERFELIIKAAIALNLIIMYEWLESATKEIQVYYVKTNLITNYQSKRHASRVLKINRKAIYTAILRGENCVSNGYAFRYKSYNPWNTNFVYYKNVPTCITATNSKTLEKIDCTSVKDAQRKTGINAKAISKVINGMPHSFDWHFVKQ